MTFSSSSPATSYACPTVTVSLNNNVLLEGQSESLLLVEIVQGDPLLDYTVTLQTSASAPFGLVQSSVLFPAPMRGPTAVGVVATGTFDNYARTGDASGFINATLQRAGCPLSSVSSNTITVLDNDRYVFIAPATVSGGAASGMDPNVYWDNFCAAQRGTHHNVAWKALIATSTRQSPVSGGLNWVLRPTHNYIRSDRMEMAGPWVFDTNALAIPLFPFGNLVEANETPAAPIWLGFSYQWENTGTNCNNWQAGASTALTAEPGGMDLGTFFITEAADCTAVGTILCVEQ